ncbi:cysteine ABC transporter permease [Paenibacillus baekrokdamisoli]|uniref:Cysteine ABC transporter permease n=1 Tax=Paenibacillus baekrokdamisoli TaxID=1712516 RepID=A0A3G9J9L3_9BACL|nr:amino acid ABC transporter permease [Paenibacillus baekrokdamisoli]MBB3071154.1 L-cystine transport system permease protein [Paenibacillus baekrokdamisoli]BBH21573.1 cysteine ABC transporter permease [Paenibacillus baekrokdamisoli]
MKLDPAFIWTAFVQLLGALPTTLEITFVSVLCGFLIGTLVALIRIFKVPVLEQLAAAYVSFIRGTPMLTHLLLIYFSLPLIIDGLAAHYGWNFHSASIPYIGFAYISFSITASAYMAEIIRSGLLAVDRGQIEAAYAVGMTTSQALRRIVFPQALAASLPHLSNSLIGMLHGSTLAFTVSVVEINAKAQIVASTNWKFFDSYIAAALIFWGLTILIERITAWIEQRINLYNRGGVA